MALAVLILSEGFDFYNVANLAIYGRSFLR